MSDCHNCDNDGVMFIGPSPCFTCIHNPQNRLPFSGLNRGTRDNYVNTKPTRIERRPCSHCNGSGTIEVEVKKGSLF